MIWRRLIVRKVSKTLNDYELAELRDQASALLSGHSQGARWKRNPDGSWSRWSYLGNQWDPGEVPGTLIEASLGRPGVTEWIAPEPGVWLAVSDLQEVIDQKPSGATAQASAPSAPSQPEPAPRVDPWHDVPPPKVSWQEDLVPKEGFEWVDKPSTEKPSPPVRSPGPTPATPHGKERKGRFRRK